MQAPFEEALQKLLDQYATTDWEEIVSALEMAKMALEEENA